MKKILTLLTILILITIPSVISTEHNSTKESGLTLDIARHFYPVETIKNFIDTLANSGGSFLHLHFSDDQNYALESDFLGQHKVNAKEKNGIFYNPNTNKPFLTYQQINDIIHYAKAHKIELIPEIGSPSHMKGIFRLIELKQGAEYVKHLQSHINHNELKITSTDSINMMKSLLTEVIEIFGGASQHFHIGGDEFGYSLENNHEFIAYVNQLNQFINSKGLTTRIWNDGVTKKNLARLNKNIEITYWSYDGDTQNPADISLRRDIRASLPDLIKHGFKVLNYNSYYLYFVPSEQANMQHDINYATNDLLHNWELGIWDGKNKHNAVHDTTNIIGSAFSIWGEHIGQLSSQQIELETQKLLKATIDKTKVTSD